MIDKEKESELLHSSSRRSFLEAGSAALAVATFVGLTANAQQRDDTRKAESDHSTNDPGQENKPLLAVMGSGIFEPKQMLVFGKI
jgi:oxalate decarboxylase